MSSDGEQEEGTNEELPDNDFSQLKKNLFLEKEPLETITCKISNLDLNKNNIVETYENFSSRLHTFTEYPDKLKHGGNALKLTKKPMPKKVFSWFSKFFVKDKKEDVLQQSRLSPNKEKYIYEVSNQKLCKYNRPLLEQVQISNLMLYIMAVKSDVTIKRRGSKRIERVLRYFTERYSQQLLLITLYSKYFK
jgi:hypothetical protein